MVCAAGFVGLPTTTAFVSPYPQLSRQIQVDFKSDHITRNPAWRKQETPTTTTSLYQFRRQWEGDDIRWISRMKRRLSPFNSSDWSIRWNSVKMWIILCNTGMYIYEVILTILQLKRKYVAYWSSRGAEMVIDSVWGTVQGPLAASLGFSTSGFRTQQTYRAFTSGFIHSSLIHLIINMSVLQRQPKWLETGLGWPLYLSTFLWSIVAGNVMHVLQSASPWDQTICLGASAGISGLYGLMFLCLSRMGSGRGGKNLVQGMAVLLSSGFWLDDVSNAANLGGFLCGIGVGVLAGPRYIKDYSMRRKNSVEYDPAPRDYRQAMGFGIIPTSVGRVPLGLIWMVLLTWGLLNPATRAMPVIVWRKLIHPR
ncbi:rhomboid family protein [Nitzschia inconspicua]|uniref:Rhomboid family protein n=1 Tax=Nitzschia inconspicua TaxID=303405 RepID=A0A9K3PR79_9STRA|nr:rhomboid family protein [Nitzschia inconspicua]